jgi:hypothetical protein
MADPERMVALSPLEQPEVAAPDTVVVVVVVDGVAPVMVVDDVVVVSGSVTYDGLIP